MKRKNILDSDKLREKVDGFSLGNGIYSQEHRYTTTDQGVFYSPDNEFDSNKKKSNSSIRQ